MFLMVASSLVFAGCKKEGCMDSKATNYDAEAKKDDGSCVFPEPPIVEPAVDTEKPKVSITKPAASAKVMAGSDLEMEATITDNEGVVSWDYKIVNGATEVGPTSATVTSAASVTGTATYSVPQDWPAGTATITITGTDAAGNVSDAVTADVTIEAYVAPDTEAPVIGAFTQKWPLTGVSISGGTGNNNGVKVMVDISDNMEIDKITLNLYNTTQSTIIGTKEYTAVGVKTWNEESQLTYTGAGNAGDEAIIKVIVTDKAGNEATLDGTVKYALGN